MGGICQLSGSKWSLVEKVRGASAVERAPVLR